ncbi:MAG: hypothetical protein GWM87_00080 [Xanthomonadales bacterium]|nr:hypothetical protein [Xanthomonadales bacterium]NIX11512.1 hypothetical protein [Xanthomonadales bacterium]
MTTVVLLLPACGLFKEKPPEYLNSEDGAALEVPEDLDEVRPVRPIAITAPQTRMPMGDELNPGPPRAVATGGGDVTAYMAWSAQGAYLKVHDSPANVARRLGTLIEESGMSLLEGSESGEYQFEYEHVRIDTRGFFRRIFSWGGDEGPDHSGAYRTRIEADGRDTRVYLMSSDGQPAETGSAEHVLGIFMERFG